MIWGSFQLNVICQVVYFGLKPFIVKLSASVSIYGVEVLSHITPCLRCCSQLFLYTYINIILAYCLIRCLRIKLFLPTAVK